jgi:CubicO group peptidase (beta-lactamase class C family)
MKSTTYNPPKRWLNRIAPTQYGIQGVVEDKHARELGGVAGHAGLFSTAHDLAVLTQMIVNGGTYNGRRFFKKSTVELFTKREKNNYGLGFDNALSVYGRSALAGAFGPNAYGHTGWTGTSVYVYPEKKIIAVYLTNRVYPSNKNMKNLAVRRAIHKAIVEALINRIKDTSQKQK